MKSTRPFLFVLLLTGLAFACEKAEQAPPANEFDGDWILQGVSGGITGKGYTPDFNILSMEKGRYTLKMEETLKSEGDYIFIPDIEYGLRFRPDGTWAEFFQFVDQPKAIIQPSPDTLTLTDPCCDLFNYHFVRPNPL